MMQYADDVFAAWLHSAMIVPCMWLAWYADVLQE